MRKVLMIVIAVIVGMIAYIILPDNGREREMDDAPGKVEEHEGADDKVDVIEEKLSRMSLNEKIGQLFIAGVDGTELSEAMLQKINHYHLGGIILFRDNMQDPEQALQLVNDLKEVHTVNNIPLFLSVDQEGGQVARLPGLQPLKSAADIGGTGDVEFAYENGRLLGRVLHAYGFHVDFAPVLDINSNPENPVIGDRAFGSDVVIVSEMGIKAMQGLQEEGIITAVKHFPGHGDTVVDSHVDLPVLNKSREELSTNEFVPFKQAIKAGADMVLVGHLVVPSLGSTLPATMSEEVISILRKEWDYEGVIVTDDLTMGAIKENYPMDEVTVKAVQAGIDILMIAHGDESLEVGFSSLKTAVQNGEISEERIDKSVRRILRLKEIYKVDQEVNQSISVEELNEDIAEVYDR